MKKHLLIIFLSIFSLYLFAQEAEITQLEEDQTAEIQEIDIKGEEFHEAETFIDFIHSIDLIMQFEPGMYFNNFKTNANGNLVSAPSPIIYPISIGFLWPNYTFVSMQPTLSFFVMEHLFYDGMALPAEIENRTTTTLSFMINLPIVFSLFINQTRFQLSGGAGIFIQAGLKSAGVNDSDYGYTGSAASDVNAINEYFWKDMHWLYLTTSFSWLYNVNSQLRIGPTVNTYIPMGTIIGNQNLHGFMITAGVKICR